MRLVTLIAALILVSGPAGAGDWNGSYVGWQIGGVNPADGSDSSAANNGSARYGGKGGQDVVAGGPIAGAKVEFGQFDLRHSRRGVDFDDVGRLKFRTTRGFGPGRAVAIVGDSKGVSTQISEPGVVYGLGLSTKVGKHLRQSGEELRRVFDKFDGSDPDLQSDRFSDRVSFQF